MYPFKASAGENSGFFFFFPPQTVPILETLVSSPPPFDQPSLSPLHISRFTTTIRPSLIFVFHFPHQDSLLPSLERRPSPLATDSSQGLLGRTSLSLTTSSENIRAKLAHARLLLHSGVVLVLGEGNGEGDADQQSRNRNGPGGAAGEGECRLDKVGGSGVLVVEPAARGGADHVAQGVQAVGEGLLRLVVGVDGDLGVCLCVEAWG